MYCNFFNLKNRPFDITPSAGLVFMSKTHGEAVAILRYGIVAEKGFVLLTGGIGSGKTTLVNTILTMLDDSIHVCQINNPTLTSKELFRLLEIALSLEKSDNKADFLAAFQQRLNEYHQHGRKLLIILDEAQAFSVDMLEEIRLLSNLSAEKNVISIFLVGQPELKEKLADPRLLPLRQRIGIVYQLKPFTEEETRQYIAYRWSQSGGLHPLPFDDKAIGLIHLEGKGTPRLINLICDQTLVLAFSGEDRHITKNHVRESMEYLRMEQESVLTTSPQIPSSPVLRDGSPQQTLVRVLSVVSIVLLLSLSGLIAYLFNSGHLFR